MFALGILATTMLMVIAVVVVGIVKVFKMNKQITNRHSFLNDSERYISNRCTDIERNAHDRSVEIERNAHDRFDRVEEHFTRAVNDQITDAVTQSNSYTDKRIDKLIDAYFEVQEVRQQSKKLIKG